MEQTEKPNTFQQMEAEKAAQPQIEDGNTPLDKKSNSEPKEIGLEIYEGGKYLKNPEVGKSIEFTIKKIVDNPDISGKDKEGVSFTKGVTKKNGEVLRYDIVTMEDEIFTLNSWELVYKLVFDKKSDFAQMAVANGGFKGLQLRITRNYDGSYKSKKTPEVMKLMDMTEAEAEAFKKEVSEAQKEDRLYTVEILNTTVAVK